MLNELKAIVVFAKVAETGSFRGAAQQLKLSPSVVSTHVSTLEAKIGKALIYRSTRKLSLTAAGEELWQHAKNVVDSAEEGMHALTGDAANPTGRLRLSVPSDFQYGRFVEDLAVFSRRYPDIVMEVDFTDRRVDLVAEAIDMTVRLDVVDDSAIEATKVHKGTRRLFASKTYLKDRPAITHPKDLTEHHIIYTAGLRQGLPFIHRKTKTEETVRVPHRIGSTTGYSALRFLQADAGLACLPSFVAAHMAHDNELIEVLPDWQLPAYGVFLVRPQNAGNRSISGLLMDFLKDQMETNPPEDDKLLARRFAD